MNLTAQREPTGPVQNRQPKSFSKVVLGLLWLVAGSSYMVSLVPGQSGLAVAAGFASFFFILLLIINLACQKPHAADLPNLETRGARPIPLTAVAGMLIAAIALLFLIGMVVVGAAVSLLGVSALVALAITITWRGKLTKSLIILGSCAGLLPGLGILFLGNGDLSWAVFNLATVPLLFVAGTLLARHTGLARLRLIKGEYRAGLRGFLWAGILAVPAALLNLLGNLQGTDTWLTHWWQPLYAIVPGIAEETWARLFLTTLAYALLRPTTNAKPGRAVFLAVLIGALTHGFLHTGIDPIGLVIGSLLYSLPTALLYIKYDFEHAVGYHFMIDFVRYIAAFLNI